MRALRNMVHNLLGGPAQEVQPGHHCRGPALRGMPNRHEIRNHLHVSRPVSGLDAWVSERRGMTACVIRCVVVASPCWGAHR
jgi:hypothetical protein